MARDESRFDFNERNVCGRDSLEICTDGARHTRSRIMRRTSEQFFGRVLIAHANENPKLYACAK